MISNNNNSVLFYGLFFQSGAHSTLQSKDKTQYKLPRADIFLPHRASDNSCAMRRSNLKQKMQFGSTNINYTIRQSLLMKIFAQFLCFQASWCSHLGSPLISAKMSPKEKLDGTETLAGWGDPVHTPNAALETQCCTRDPVHTPNAALETRCIPLMLH